MFRKVSLNIKLLLNLVLGIFVALIAIALLLRLPTAVDLAQAKFVANNIPNNKVTLVSINSDGYPSALKKKVTPFPKIPSVPAPSISANAVIIKDLESNYVLYAKEPNKQVPIASTTKLMTGIVGVSHFRPNDVLTVPTLLEIDGSNMGLRVGEQLTFRSLLYGMLLNSGNDAAFTIAANYPGGVDAFIENMNNQTSKMGLINTHFDNPAGYDSVAHYSSASDLAVIASVAADDSQLARVVSTKETTVASVDKSIIHQLKNLNKLLGGPGVLGMKTGTTPLAKENLVGLFERDGHKILTVLLGSDNRFKETEELVDWVYANYSWQ